MDLLPRRVMFQVAGCDRCVFLCQVRRSGESTTVDHSPQAKTCDSAQSNEVGSGEMMARTGKKWIL